MIPLFRAAFLAWAACAWQPALACGFHDQVSMLRGMMNWVYPESLHVGTAVWMAQADGRLARDELGQQDDLAPEARTRLGYLRITFLLGRFKSALAEARGDDVRPSLAVVLLGPMLWSRYETDGNGVLLKVHADGPAQSDVIVVTEAPVIEALAAGRLSARDALQLGVIKLYGNAADSKTALDWLSAIGSDARSAR